MFDSFQKSLPKVVFGLLIFLIVYFVSALNGKNGFAYSYALKNEVKELEAKLAQMDEVNANLRAEIELWEKHPESMTEEYLISKWAMKRTSARYFDYLEGKRQNN